MKKYILTVGLNDKDTKLQKFDIITSYKLVEAILKQHTNGYTIYETRGGYRHENGEFVMETSLRIELLFVEDKTCRDIAKAIKAPTCLNQETIAYEVVETNSELI